MGYVTYLNQLVRDGMDVDEASVKGAGLRFRPIRMTASTTALGLVPLFLSWCGKRGSADFCHSSYWRTCQLNHSYTFGYPIVIQVV
ncbi:MAG: hypothetical protein ACI9CF_001948 [Candidatus Omnitrophota bacterium]|jgi:hypothetical protein